MLRLLRPALFVLVTAALALPLHGLWAATFRPCPYSDLFACSGRGLALVGYGWLALPLLVLVAAWALRLQAWPTVALAALAAGTALVIAAGELADVRQQAPPSWVLVALAAGSAGYGLLLRRISTLAWPARAATVLLPLVALAAVHDLALR